MKAVEAVKEIFYCFLGIVYPTVYNTVGEPDYKDKDKHFWGWLFFGCYNSLVIVFRVFENFSGVNFVLGVYIFQGWIYFIGDYFPGVRQFFRGEYFSGVNIFQEWIFFRSAYFSGEIFFERWIFLRGHRSRHSLNIWLSPNIFGLVSIVVMSEHT